MSLLDRFGGIAREREELLGEGVNPFGVEVEEVHSATEASIQGRRVLLAGTNNYLGLTFEPSCIEAGREALEKLGTGTTGSRMANGSLSGHLALERELADFYGWRSGIIFSAGYLANLAMITALTGSDDTVLIDMDCHASIYDGCRLSGAQILRFRHNDPDSLAKRLQRLGEKAKRTLIIVEGIYSMLGDRAPLAELAAVKREHGGYLLVDEAHSMGVLGQHGLGRVEESGTEGDVDLVVGTFSKSLGAVGGFCVSDRMDLDLIRYTARPYIFTASPSPSVVASVRQALSVIRNRPELKDRLWESSRRLYHGLAELGYELGPEPSPVVAATLPTPGTALEFWRRLLLEEGIYVNLMMPPATPGGKPLMRCSVSASHTPAQIDAIIEAFRTLRNVSGVNL